MSYVFIHLDKLIKKRGISQQELSRITGIRQPTISEMCRNKSLSLPLNNLAQICDALDCEIHDLLEFKKEAAE